MLDKIIRFTGEFWNYRLAGGEKLHYIELTIIAICLAAASLSTAQDASNCSSCSIPGGHCQVGGQCTTASTPSSEQGAAQQESSTANDLTKIGSAIIKLGNDLNNLQLVKSSASQLTEQEKNRVETANRKILQDAQAKIFEIQQDAVSNCANLKDIVDSLKN